MISRFVPALMTVAMLSSISAQAQLTPRQLFYDDGKKPPPAKKLPEAEAVVPKPTPPKKGVAVRPIPKKVEEPERAKRIPAFERPNGNGARIDGGRIDGVRIDNVQFTPLVLRYSILKMVEADQWVEVAEDSRFQTGERIQIQAEGNQNGYLYILAQGTSGTWQTLFPRKDLEGGDNRVTPHTPVRYPSEDKTFTFAGKPGTEKIFIAYSRNPDEDIDKLIYEVNRNANPATGNRTMMAYNTPPIQNSEVEKLKIRSRDLIIETVKENDVASRKPKAASIERMKETAVYVATKDSSPGAKVIAEIRLKHE